MKKLLLLFTLAAWLLEAGVATAQETAQSELLATLTPTKLKDGYAMHQGIMLQIRNGQVSNLDRDVTLANGAKIYRNGYIQLPGQKKQKLPEDYAVNLNGKMVMLQYDMMRYEAIREHSQKLLGETDTDIIITDKGRVIAGNAEQKASTEQLINRRVTIINERNGLIQQKAILLNKAKNVQEQRTSPAIKEVDAQIQKLTAELNQVEQQLQ